MTDQATNLQAQAPPAAILPPATVARSPWLLIAVAFTSMLVFGFVENIKGVVIPPIRSTYGVSYESIGIMLFIGSSGYLVATFIGGLASDRVGLKPVIGMGYLLIMTSALAMLVAGTFEALCVMMFL